MFSPEQWHPSYSLQYLCMHVATRYVCAIPSRPTGAVSRCVAPAPGPISRGMMVFPELGGLEKRNGRERGPDGIYS